MNKRASDIKDKVFAFVKRENLLKDLSIIYIGFSGGSDSTALVHLFKEYYKKVKVIHFNHGIREKDSDKDESWCRTFCKLHKIPFNTVKLNIPENKESSESVEMAARRLRLTYWKSTLTNEADSAVMLAHHLDDKLENFFIRLSRGSNSSGLTGLRSITHVQGVKILRPLLCLEKTEIIEYLHANDIIDYRHDKSNTDLRYKRNRIRHLLIPHLFQTGFDKEAVFKSLNYLEDDARYLEFSINEFESKSKFLTVRELLHLDFALWSRKLRRWKNENCGDNAPIKGSLLKNLKKSLTHDIVHGAEFEISKTHKIAVDRDHLILREKKTKINSVNYYWDCLKHEKLFIPEIGCELHAKKCNYSKNLNLNEPNCQYWNLKEIRCPLYIRQRKTGDTLIPFAMDKPVRVKKLIANAKLTIEEKQSLIIICDNDNNILWIPLVRRSNFAKVKPNTSKLVKITYNKLN